MHFVFIPYGGRHEIEVLLRDMEAQKHPLKMWKGKEKKIIYINGIIRMLPFGIYEYAFPKENLDTLLNTLMPTGKRYNVGWLREKVLQVVTGVEKIPKTWKKEQKFMWMKQYVNIIPIGIRHDDAETMQKVSKHEGWQSEAL